MADRKHYLIRKAIYRVAVDRGDPAKIAAAMEKLGHVPGDVEGVECIIEKPKFWSEPAT